MAFYVKNLGYLKEGEKLFLPLNLKEVDFFLIKKDETMRFSFDVAKISSANLILRNTKETITIPINGYWQLAIRNSGNFNYL